MQKIISILLLAFFLTACGFHLRGSEPIPTELKTLQLITENTLSDFTELLKQALQSRGIQLVSNQQKANALHILSANLNQQVTSIGSGGQNTIYLLTYSVKYQLLNEKGQLINSGKTISTTRNYSAGSNQILADTYVQQDLVADMQRDVIAQLIYQLTLTQQSNAVTP